LPANNPNPANHLTPAEHPPPSFATTQRPQSKVLHETQTISYKKTPQTKSHKL
jgi:hypothetical protein